MRRPIAPFAPLALVAAALGAGCHRPHAATAVAPIPWPAEAHCWWAPFRTTLPPDSVAARFARAYAALGLSDTTWSRQADTAWADAGPTVLGDSTGRVVHAARVVAFRRGDSTLFRPFVAIASGDSTAVGRRRIELCGAAMREARTAAVAPRDEERDRSLPVWRRRR